MFLLELFDLFSQLVAGGGAAGGCGVFLQHLDAALDFAGEGYDVFGAQAGECAFVVAVQVDQSLEGALFATAEEPVDGALFIGLQVVFEELVGNVAANGLVWGFRGFGAQALGQPGHVVFQCVWPPDGTQEFTDAAGCVVGKPEFVGDGDDAVSICGEGGVAARLKADVARVGIDQAGLVEAVAAHHATNGVGDQALAVFFAVGTG